MSAYEGIGVPVFVEAQGLCSGNPNLAMWFVSQIFALHPVAGGSSILSSNASGLMSETPMAGRHHIDSSDVGSDDVTTSISRTVANSTKNVQGK
jgi:hypothetical protein